MKLRLAVSVAVLAVVLLGQQPQRRERAGAPGRARHARRGGRRSGIRHRSRHAHVLPRRQCRGCRRRHHAGRQSSSSSPTSASAAKRPSWSAPRTARCTPSPASAPCPNWPPRSSSATTNCTEERDDLAARSGRPARTGCRWPAFCPRWCRAWWKPRWSRCANTAPNPSPRSCSRPSNWPTAFPSTKCASTPSINSVKYLRGVARLASAPSCPTAARRSPATSSASPIWRAPCAPWRTPKSTRWPRGANRDKAIDAVRDFFYRGEIAHRIDAFSKAHNGLHPLRRHGRLPRRARGAGLHHLQGLHRLQARLLEPGTRA